MGAVIANAVRSEWMKATAHILTLIVSVLGMPALIWLVTTTRDLDKEVAVMRERDKQHEVTAKTLTDAVTAISKSRADDTKESTDLRIAMGRVLEKLDAHSNTLRRIETELDKQRPIGRP